MIKVIDRIKVKIGRILWNMKSRRMASRLIVGHQYTRPWDLNTKDYKRFGDAKKWEDHFRSMGKELEGVFNSLHLRDTRFEIKWMNAKNCFYIQIITNKRNVR